MHSYVKKSARPQALALTQLVTVLTLFASCNSVHCQEGSLVANVQAVQSDFYKVNIHLGLSLGNLSRVPP